MRSDERAPPIMMNKLIHDIINKFNAINLMCGTLALEAGRSDEPGMEASRLKERLADLLINIEADLVKARGMLDEIIRLLSGELNCYKENEHFFKIIEPGILTIDEKREELKRIVAGSGTGEPGAPLPINNIISLLHATEEKALACGIVLKELRSNLISSGKYNTEDE